MEQKSNRHPLEGVRILIADDEFLIALDMEATFRNAGAVVIGPFLTYSETMTAVLGETFDAAMLDVRLGVETTEPIADLLAARHIPFFFYSGQQPREKIHTSAPAQLIAKPAQEEVLVGTMARLLADRAA